MAKETIFPTLREQSAGQTDEHKPLLSVRGLQVQFRGSRGVVHAVDGVDYDLYPGEVLGIVGESGSGKSVSAQAMLGLIPQPPGRIVAGSVQFKGRDLLKLPEKEMRRLRGKEIAMVFQDPMTSLNPVMRIGTQVSEAIATHERNISKSDLHDRVMELMQLVGIPNLETRYYQYPHEFSGGMRQRVMIAMAMANRPSLLIADEPTTALDVTIQAQILEVLKRARSETGAATIMITHDLGLIAELADRVLVMYAGRVVEDTDVYTLFNAPRHPYTVGLMESRPRVAGADGPLHPIPGQPPSLVTRPTGCAFHPRCFLARDRCKVETPALRHVGDEAHRSACHFSEELAAVVSGR